MATHLGTVADTWRYPVKSMQGVHDAPIEVGPAGIVGDRAWGLLDGSSGRLLSAKRVSALLTAAADDEQILLPDGTTVRLGAPGADAALSAWLGRPVTLSQPVAGDDVAYEMTFDPPNDDADVFEIPAPAGTFLDLAAVHLVASSTLAACAAARPDLDWDVRRFRPNVVVDTGDTPVFVEDDWVGSELRVGTAVLSALMPTVRCAMPLRAQPGGIAREPGLFAAMGELHPAHPNHLGLYLQVVQPGTVHVGDLVELC